MRKAHFRASGDLMMARDADYDVDDDNDRHVAPSFDLIASLFSLCQDDRAEDHPS